LIHYSPQHAVSIDPRTSHRSCPPPFPGCLGSSPNRPLLPPQPATPQLTPP
jgi:hypothetical protein